MTNIPPVPTHIPPAQVDRGELERAVQAFEDRGGYGMFRPDFAEDAWETEDADVRRVAVDELVELVRMQASDTEVSEYVNRHFATLKNGFGDRHSDNESALNALADAVKGVIHAAS